MGVRAVWQWALASLRPGKTGRAAPVGTTEPMRILVVDDDQGVLDTAERVLSGDGHIPILTGSPQSVLQIALSLRPRAIFLDVLMPGFDGWDVLLALKTDPATSAIPVLMIGMLGEQGRALEAGAAGVVSKPLDAAKMRAAMARISLHQSSSR